MSCTVLLIFKRVDTPLAATVVSLSLLVLVYKLPYAGFFMHILCYNMIHVVWM